MENTITNATNGGDLLIKALIVSAGVSFVVAFTVSVLIGLYYFRKYPQSVALSKEQRTTEVISIFFMIMTALYTVVGVAIDRLDAIPLSFFVAGVFGNVVGAKTTEAIQKVGKK